MAERISVFLNRTWPALLLFVVCIIAIAVTAIKFPSSSVVIGVSIVGVIGIIFAMVWFARLAKAPAVDVGGFGSEGYQGPGL